MPRPKSEAAWKKEVGSRLKAARESIRPADVMTQEELAPIIGVSRSSLANVETGRSMLPPAAARRLADRYGIPMEWIYRGSLIGMPQWLMDQLAPRSSLPPTPASEAPRHTSARQRSAQKKSG